MRIGIDFDNTIVDCEGGHAAAVERGLIGADFPKRKNAVRDYLNHSGRSEAFTELQGYVFGARVDLTRPREGSAISLPPHGRAVTRILWSATRYAGPLLGSAYDLHGSARAFPCCHGIVADEAIAGDHVFFEETKQEEGQPRGCPGTRCVH